MQGREIRVEIGREELTLLPEGAIHWPAQNAVLVADVHVGKAAAFRAESVPVPAGSSQASLDRLGEVLTETGAGKLFLLGDLWHARQGRTEQIRSMFAGWRHRHIHVEMILIEGNHDRKAGAMEAELNIQTVPDLLVGNFLLRHHPEEDERGYVLAGHIHPAVRLVGAGRQSERLPAFWFGPRIGVLPAFGDFTGCATVYPSENDRVFVLTGNEILEVGLTGVGAGRS